MRISDWSSDVCSSDLDGELWIVEGAPWPVPPGTREVKRAVLAQMVAEDAPPAARDSEPPMLSLSDADAVWMAALAEHAQPGPWGPTTHRYGPFFGIRENGRDRKSTRLNSSH